MANIVPIDTAPGAAEGTGDLPSTGERFIPGLGGSIELEHLHRYLFAKQACADRVVLDIACGEGYGSAMLAQAARSVIGVDISAEAVAHARKHYKAPNLRFATGSCAAIPLDDASVDVVVSFETIEHHDQHEEMMREIRRVLRAGGLLVLSSPERFEYSERPGTHNEFHVHELYRDEFVELVGRHFPHFELYDQKVLFGSAILPEGTTTRTVSGHADSPYERARGLVRPVFLIAVASDRTVEPLDTGIFEQALEKTSEWQWWIDTVNQRDAAIRSLNAEVGPQAAEIAELRAHVAQLEGTVASERAASAQELESHRLQEAALRNAVERTLAQERIEAERLRGRIAGMEAMHDRQASEHSETVARVANLAAEAAMLRERHARSVADAAAAAAAIIERDRRLAEEARIAESERAARAALYASTSWRVTAPLRGVKDAWTRLRRVPRSAYRRLPVDPTMKAHAKDAFFGTFGFALRDTAAYRDWLAFNAAQRGPTPSAPAETPRAEFASDSPQPASAAEVLPIAQLEEEVTVMTEALPTEPDYSASGATLWVADGTKEWSELAPLREQIAAMESARLSSVAPSSVPMTSLEACDPQLFAEHIAFASVAEPKATILIPAFNHIELTLECLASIARARTQASYEVVVADDASTDATAEILARVANIRVHRNPENLHFLRNCNAALPSVRGEFVVFLNNDVQVQDGWLDALLGVFDGDDEVGAAGPKIVYPSGHLQEAGVALNVDMTVDMIGLGDDPALPRYNYGRRVDYASGACLVVRTAVVRDLGGFSQDLAPAYCEDADLCLRLRDRGLSIRYVPEAVVVHRLSATTAADGDEGKRRLVARNLATIASRWQSRVEADADVRAIAFYLPQFYPFPENDRWWGKGFTEWTNVAKAQPNFVGHYQPHLPADLGYYDLRVAKTMEDQAALARRYGLAGFCFYYYWFAGKRLLDLPVERMLATGKPDFPFCLCWANENWTRRWDGQDTHVLMAQSHSDEDDEAVILDLIRYFRSPNYIRIDGRPLLMVYRVTLFPDFAKTAAHWRQVCRDEGIGEIHLSMVESFELVSASFHPSQFGCDATVEFPPQGLAETVPPSGKVINREFTGHCVDYRSLALRYCSRPAPGYTRFRGAMPGWDNTPRRQNNSYCIEHSTPGAFQAWLEYILEDTRRQHFGDERIVFINAWNEWAEGAHLEPDRRFGHTYLEALRNAKDRQSTLDPRRYAF